MTKADDCVMNGRVKSWDNNLRSGFITSETGEEVFVLINDIDGCSHLVKGQRVQFKVGKNKKGLGPKARDVKVLLDEPVVSSSGENNYFQNEVSPSTETAENLQYTRENSKGKYIELYIDETGNPGMPEIDEKTGEPKIDEKGEPSKPEDFTIGGIYAVYKNKEQADQFNYELTEEEGIYPFERPSVEDEGEDEYLDWYYPGSEERNVQSKEQVRKVAIKKYENKISKNNQKNGIFCEAIWLTCPAKTNENYSKYKYGLNISMLRCLIELFLYEVLPEKKDPVAKIAIYIATRIQPKDNKQDAETEKYRSGRGYMKYTEYKEKYRSGRRYTESEEKYLTYYIGSDTPHTLMEEVFHLHRNKEIINKLYKLLGVTLAYKKKRNTIQPLWEFVKSGIGKETYRTIKFKGSREKLKKLEEELEKSEKKEGELEKLKKREKSEKLKKSNDMKEFADLKKWLEPCSIEEKGKGFPLPRPMHYVADALLGQLNNDKLIKPKFQETYDESLPKFINASRLLDQGKYLEALEEVINEEWPNEQDKEKKKGRYYILQRLGSVACPEISNEDFYHLVSIYATESKSKSSNSTTS